VPRGVRLGAGQLVDALVFRVAVVALDPFPGELVRGRRRDQLVPEALLADRLLADTDPALLLPAGNPLGHSVDDVAAVGMDGDFARLDQRAETADHGGHLHAVVGRVRLAAAQFLLVPAHSEQRRPAAGAGIALAGSVGENV